MRSPSPTIQQRPPTARASSRSYCAKTSTSDWAVGVERARSSSTGGSGASTLRCCAIYRRLSCRPCRESSALSSSARTSADLLSLLSNPSQFITRHRQLPFPSRVEIPRPRRARRGLATLARVRLRGILHLTHHHAHWHPHSRTISSSFIVISRHARGFGALV